MNTNELLTMFLQFLAPAVLDMIGIAAFGMALVAFFSQLAGKTRSMVFFDKYAQQGATLGLWLLVIGLVSGAVGMYFVLARFPGLGGAFLDNIGLTRVAAISGGLYAVAYVLYATLWKKLRKSKGLHLLIGGMAALASMTVLAASAALFLVVPGYGGGVLPLETNSLLWPMAAQFLFLAMTHAAGLSGPYLALRRNRDDFGRDYYAFAMRTASLRALSSMILLLAATAWMWFVLPTDILKITTDTSLWMAWAAFGLLGLLCIGAWGALAANERPMRLKGLSFTAAVLLWLMHTCLFAIYFNLFFMFSSAGQ